MSRSYDSKVDIFPQRRAEKAPIYENYERVRVVCVDHWGRDVEQRKAEYGVTSTTSPLPKRHPVGSFKKILKSPIVSKAEPHTKLLMQPIRDASPIKRRPAR